MSNSDVTVISLVTDKTRDAICQSIVPSIGRALSNHRARYQRLPVTRDYIDWVVDDTDTLTVAIDEAGQSSVVLVASRGVNTQACASRLANIAAELCQEYDVHTVFWNGSEKPLAAADFIAAGDGVSDLAFPKARIIPRKIKSLKTQRAAPGKSSAQLDHWMMSALRTQMNGVTLEEVERLELEQRRAKTAPMRLSAWAISLTTAVFAMPLAIPLIVHNLVRGEDVRSGAMALGVVGLYAALDQTGMAPGLTGLL
ncbi:hypothetical protein [Marivita sp.]|uniref:hypothetical protein n=1 Tax=Marivita sp. TaxID=2003365 RepID=UPI003F70AAF6